MAELARWNEPSWMERAFSDFFNSDVMSGNGHSNLPKVNVAENEKEYRIEVCAPGMSKKDVKVNIENNRLIIQGEKKEEKEEKEENYTRKEFRTSSFSRSFILPENVDPEKTDAKFEDGILHLTIAKRQADTSKAKKEIQIK